MWDYELDYWEDDYWEDDYEADYPHRDEYYDVFIEEEELYGHCYDEE